MARTCNRKHAHEARSMVAPEARRPRRRPANPTRAPGKRRTPIVLKPSGDGLPVQARFLPRAGCGAVPTAMRGQRPASAPISNDTFLDVALVHPDATDRARAGRYGLFRAPRHGRFPPNDGGPRRFPDSIMAGLALRSTGGPTPQPVREPDAGAKRRKRDGPMRTVQRRDQGRPGNSSQEGEARGSRQDRRRPDADAAR